jgi:tight adherence protein B
LLVAVLAAAGVHLLYTAVAFGWRGIGPSSKGASDGPTIRRRLEDWLVPAGLEGVRLSEFVSVVAVLAVVAFVVALAFFDGGFYIATVIALFAATFPVAAYRNRRSVRREAAAESWPMLIEELRVRTTSLGRSIPQALFEVGLAGPEELRPAFAAAHREWMLSTDFARTIEVLKSRLADPTADAVCETLLVAHDVGGSDIASRLSALADDRMSDTQDRKDARSRQAGVRFARRFVLIVPAGMALAGSSIGEGRAAFATGLGQAAAIAAVGLVALCWLWAGHIMKLPEAERVFG